MIRKIEEDELDLISPLLNKYGQESGSNLPPNFVEQITTSVEEGKSFVYGAVDNNNLNGIGIFGNVSKRFSLVYAGGDSNLEVQLIDTLFNNHSTNNRFISTAGRWISDAISMRLVELGFRKLDRAFMTLDRKSIEALEDSSLSEDMELEVYHNSQIDEVSQLMFKGNDGHIDQIVFPNFFGTVEQCKNLIENIEDDMYGDYKEPYSWLLRGNGKLIGACFLTIRKNGESGYIPDITIDPDYQGKGLGKALLVHSMKEILSGIPDIKTIDLDVTLENNARFLYKSLGYETVSEYSMYTWLNKKND